MPVFAFRITGVRLEIKCKVWGMHIIFSRMTAVGTLLFLGACALPIPYQIASLVADGVSLITTDKTVADHGISMVMERDCSFMRSMQDGKICRDYAGETESIDDEVFRALAMDRSVGETENVSGVPDGSDALVSLANGRDVADDLASFETAAGSAADVQPTAGTYWIIGSFARMEDASRMAQTYDSLTPEVVPGTARGRKVWRVAVASDSSESNGGAIQHHIRDLGIRDAWLLKI